MALASLHLSLSLLAAAGEKSKTPFYVAGAVLAAWAVILGVVGITRPNFPHNVLGSRAVMGISAVLVITTMTMAVVTASKPPKESAAEAKATQGGPAPGAGQGAVAFTADPSGNLKYEQKTVSAAPVAGALKIDFTNKSPVPHNVTIEQNGKNITATPTITGSTTSVVARLKPGTYTFFCSVDGHRQAGMVGKLTVS
jgi:plastocyanin